MCPIVKATNPKHQAPNVPINQTITVTFNGFGEEEQISPFENKYTEERFYNRTVVIDIITKL